MAQPEEPAGHLASSPARLDRERPLVIADVGCGKGYLTFGVWHLFHRVWKRQVRVIGVEARKDLVELTASLASRIGAAGLELQHGAISDLSLPRLDALIALHACDTATDDAIVQGIEAGAQLIVTAPCCHKELRPQLRHPPALAPVLRHGIMEARLSEWVTDGLRALYLEWAGYKTKIFEFIASEHTEKNLMIAAVRGGVPFQSQPARERLIQLKDLFGIERHALDRLLRQAAPGP